MRVTMLDGFRNLSPLVFRQTFPGAGGVISLSQVGFDSTLHEAIVSTRLFVAASAAWVGSTFSKGAGASGKLPVVR